MLDLANLVRRKKALETRWNLFEIISKQPGISLYELAKQLNWSTGKVTHHINKLIKDGVITNKNIIENNRPKRTLTAKNWKEFMDPEILEALKNDFSTKSE